VVYINSTVCYIQYLEYLNIPNVLNLSSYHPISLPVQLFLPKIQQQWAAHHPAPPTSPVGAKP
jgi:hypothetical protein